MAQTQAPQIRLATREDVPEILAMIKELAEFENALDSVHATHDTLKDTLTFAPSKADPNPKTGYAKTFLLTLPSSTNGSATQDSAVSEQIAGMALFFNNYSTWLACPGVYLEDLYVRPQYRRRGYATLLLKEMAAEASRVSNGKGRLEWSCLRWNKGALEFYQWLGGKRMEDWVGIRVEGEGLAKMATIAESKK